MVVIARDVFGPHLLADITRFLLCGISLCLVMVCMKIAWMRARSPQGHPLREQSPWALLSYGGFAFIPTVLGFRNLGKPLDPLLTPIFALALAAGVLAMFGQITIRLWSGGTRRDRPATEEAADDDL
jgi:hypothetical protein